MAPVKNADSFAEPVVSTARDKLASTADFDETRVKCYIDGAYMDVCVYDNLCLGAHDDFVFISKDVKTGTQIDKHMWHTGGVKYVDRCKIGAT